MTKKPEVKISKWMSGLGGQTVSVNNGNTWLVTDLIEKAKDLPVMEIPIEHLYIDYSMECQNIREFVARMKNVMEADLDCPILLDFDGMLFDGRHRIAKTLFLGKPTIKAKRFEEDISPNYNSEKRKKN